MRSSISLVITALVLVAAQSGPADSERTRIIRFFKEHVIGKTLASSPTTTTTDQGRIEGVYEDQTTFGGLMETENGFRLDLTMVARETLHELDKNGKRSTPGQSLNGVRVYRYELVERRSSGKVVGFGRFISSTVKQDPFAGTVFLVRMRMEGGALIVEETQAGYADFVAARGTHKPVASDVTSKYFLKGGKLEIHLQQKTFDVDPKTLQRTPTRDTFPVQVSREIGGK